MKRRLIQIFSCLLSLPFVLGAAACHEEESKMAPERDWIETTTWNDEMMEAYLRPYWYTREIYNETVTFVGEEGEATLIYTPTEVRSVRSYTLETAYTEGKDYTIEGNKIKRIKGSAMPYWEPDEYFLKEPNMSGVAIGVNAAACEFQFEESRYLYYGEGDSITKKQVAVTYRHAEEFTGAFPSYQPEKLARFLKKTEEKQAVNIMVYGDSVAVGCNASGTSYGGNINPHMPDYANIVKQYIEKNCGISVNLENQAVGGWKVADCINAYSSRIANKQIDLMILRIGGNDGDASETRYLFEMNKLLTMFFTEYPEAEVIVQTPELPNQQSTWTLNVGKIGGWTEQIVSESAYADQIAVARVQDFTGWVESRGKRTRDWLANNINHANDFMIRVYAQIILTAMFGPSFTGER